MNLKKVLLQSTAIANCLMAVVVSARSPLSVESTYLGGGWFRYTVVVVDDPFFVFLDVNGFQFLHPSIVERGPDPAGWTNNPAAGLWGFAGASPGAQSLPYTASFLVRSSETHFKRGGVATLSLTFSTIGGYHGIPASGVAAGFWPAPILVPCPANEADGSSTNLLVTNDSLALPDIRITGLPRTGETIHGVSYEFSAENTVRLEGSYDLRTWTNIAYIYGVNGVTTWTTNRTLNAFGNFFRLRLVDYGHASNLPPLSATGGTSATTLAGAYQAVTFDEPASTSLEFVRILAVRPKGDLVEVDFSAEPGRAYRVIAHRELSQPIDMVRAVAGKALETVLIPVADKAGDRAPTGSYLITCFVNRRRIRRQNCSRSVSGRTSFGSSGTTAFDFTGNSFLASSMHVPL